ncbi:hypothetical protein GPECTOR_17g875 [Gonium pectorale]|uniref:Uncharacterized protein n=1 Tax=Gonium pectorale TaxID=33097 RepID=A0A150GKC6_GONPE|nr:hypothetical protein GPECTOR_17g875 [Gonium pectorale]|eukprot:KXZ50237.1 hypothetical protein GPECTOR_17g875 [Gonium pectorale]
MLNFSFASNNKLVLGSGVTLTLRRLVVADLFSRSSLAYDFFAPSQPGSAIVWQDVTDRRSLCPPMESQPSQLLALSAESVCLEAAGRCFQPVMRGRDVLVESTAGYQIRWNNTVTVCDRFISQDCVARLGVDLCYLTEIEDLLARRRAALNAEDTAGQPGSSGGLGSGAQAGLIAGCVAGGVALLALVVVLCAFFHRRRCVAYAAAATHGLAHNLGATNDDVESSAGVRAPVSGSFAAAAGTGHGMDSSHGSAATGIRSDWRSAIFRFKKHQAQQAGRRGASAHLSDDEPRISADSLRSAGGIPAGGTPTGLLSGSSAGLHSNGRATPVRASPAGVGSLVLNHSNPMFAAARADIGSDAAASPHQQQRPLAPPALPLPPAAAGGSMEVELQRLEGSLLPRGPAPRVRSQPSSGSLKEPRRDRPAPSSLAEEQGTK